MLIIKEHFHYYNQDCHRDHLNDIYSWSGGVPVLPKPLYFKNRKDAVCFNVVIDSKDDSLKKLRLETSYFIGLQHIKEWNIPVLVEPKMDTTQHQLDFQKMLIEALTEAENFEHLDSLIDIDFNAEWIEVDTKHHIELTPFLVIQFLMAVKQLVRKGLKKSYYTKTENLQNRVKGKILVGTQVKQNILKQRLTQTVCTYQEFGFDTPENRFIKHVLHFVYAYISNYQDERFKTQLTELLHYNLAAFHQVGDETFKSYTQKETNPFYKLYNTTFDLGNQLLKLMSHSYEKSIAKVRRYPPHWIDMSALFELYVFKKLREKYPKPVEVKYHYKTNYQELDYIVNSNGFKAVVDAKYKPRYKGGRPSKEDARQLSGYARLNSVYKELNLKDDQLIPVYIIYPKGFEEIVSTKMDEEHVEGESIDGNLPTSILAEDTKVKCVTSYRQMFLQEVELPFIIN